MKASLILEKINDTDSQRQWHRYLDKMEAALQKLRTARQSQGRDQTKLEYLEAALRFSEARDDERNFFWDTFVEPRIDTRR
ncbi:MAG: hypothetical protein ABII79_04640 [bacterium]